MDLDKSLILELANSTLPKVTGYNEFNFVIIAHRYKSGYQKVNVIFRKPENEYVGFEFDSNDFDLAISRFCGCFAPEQGVCFWYGNRPNLNIYQGKLISSDNEIFEKKEQDFSCMKIKVIFRGNTNQNPTIKEIENYKHGCNYAKKVIKKNKMILGKIEIIMNSKEKITLYESPKREILGTIDDLVCYGREIAPEFIHQDLFEKQKNKINNYDKYNNYFEVKRMERDSFNAMTDGQLGSYDDYNGNIDDIMNWAGRD